MHHDMEHCVKKEMSRNKRTQQINKDIYDISQADDMNVHVAIRVINLSIYRPTSFIIMEKHKIIGCNVISCEQELGETSEASHKIQD